MGKNNIDRLSQYTQEKPILWKDRKRYLGLPLSFTRYSFDEDKFYSNIGLLKTEKNELLLYRVLDIKLVRTLGQKIFGVGSVILVTADKTTPEFHIKNIKDSERVFKSLSTIIEKERDEKRVLGKEMFGAAGHHADNCDFDGHIDGI